MPKYIIDAGDLAFDDVFRHKSSLWYRCPDSADIVGLPIDPHKVRISQAAVVIEVVIANNTCIINLQADLQRTRHCGGDDLGQSVVRERLVFTTEYFHPRCEP